MIFHVITVLPEIFRALHFGVIGRAIKEKLVDICIWNPRDFTNDIHKTIDDRPYGGGPGMLMMAEPLAKTIQSIKQQYTHAPVIALTPQGKTLQQSDIHRFKKLKSMILLAGRYEGIDERLLTHYADEEISIGDYVLSGGEFAAMVIIDGIIRLLPGTLHSAESIQHESFDHFLLDYPHYTRPALFEGETVPEILLSGHHAKIKRWRLKQSLGRTWLRRPDLLQQRDLNIYEKTLLDEFIKEYTTCQALSRKS